MQRFIKGQGTILDLEFLVDDRGRRVAAFGRAAGLAGCALGILVWCHQQVSVDTPFPSVRPYPTVDALVTQVSRTLALVVEKTGKQPKVHVMGAKGRCGGGAVEFCTRAGIREVVEWDMAETAKGGPFEEILEADVFVNCVLLQGAVKPFLVKEMLSKPRRLSVISDVSCDYTNPHNPLPIYDMATTFPKPTLRIEQAGGGPPVDVISIDHLPSMIPLESSTDFSNDLFPTLLQLADWVQGKHSPVWQRAAALFADKCEEARS